MANLKLLFRSPPLAVAPASRRLHEISDLADGGTVTLMDDRESPFQKGRYSDDIRMLRENFILEEVARRGQFRVYRLSNGPGD